LNQIQIHPFNFTKDFATMNIHKNYTFPTDGSFAISPWFYTNKPNPAAKLRVFCFPYAGGNAAIFNEWYNKLDIDIEVVSISFPGRWLRSEEQSVSCMWQLTNEITDAIQQHNQKDFIFFGHSMGGILSYQVAQELFKRGAMLPNHIFVSACEAPHCAALRTKRKRVDQCNETDLLEHIQSLAGTPEEFLKDESMKQRIFQSMIPDLVAIDNWVYEPLEPLGISLTAFAGKQDHFVSIKGVREWQKYTTKDFNFNILTGGHFFINEKENKRIFNTINRTLQLDI